MKKIFLITILFAVKSAHTQTQQQWAQLVGWDGVSHFSKYIIFNAGHMGPNALTIPSLTNGSIDSINAIGLTGQLHFAKGDKTQNFNVYGNFCLARNRVAVDVAWLPVEFFKMTDTIKRERHVYYLNYFDKQAKGDVQFSTNINLLNKWRNKTQLALRVGVRLPSSSSKGVAAARFIDATSYWVDVSMGKYINPQLRWISMAGLYVWQMDKGDLRQNDAFLFGTGLEWNKNNWKLQPYFAGYLGYEAKSGDKPIVFRFNAEKKLNKIVLMLRLQQGLNDFKYTSVETGIKWLLKSTN
ncbi:MAG TPA: hypothetical protein PK275_05035 [Chitinophagaceae bacterium]|jgi:hypothetical protein|nr:hypothetical protein [Chitinophagaceae bacterium]